MPQFSVTAPDGTQYSVNAPDGANEQDAINYVQANHQPDASVAQPATDTPAAPAPKYNPMGTGSGPAAATYVNGGLFGAGDEAVSGATAAYQTLADVIHGRSHDDANGNANSTTLGDLSKYYNENLDDYRTGQSVYAEQHPGRAAGYGLAGGAATVIPAMLMGDEAAPLSLGQKAIQGAKTGAVVGAVSGFNNGEGGFVPRVENAGKGAAEFSALSAATPVVLAGGSNIVHKAWDAGKGLANIVGDTVTDWTNPQRAALQKVGQSLVNDATPAPGGAAPSASVDDVINRIQNNGLTPAEAGGPNIEAMTDAYIQKPGAARPYATAMMADRTATQRDKIAAIVQNALGTDGSGTNAIEMAQASKAKIGPLADAAFQPAEDVTNVVGADPTMQRLLGNKDVQAGIPRGLRILQNEADANGTTFNPSDYGVTGYTDAAHPDEIADLKNQLNAAVFNHSKLLDLHDELAGSVNGTSALAGKQLGFWRRNSINDAAGEAQNLAAVRGQLADSADNVQNLQQQVDSKSIQGGDPIFSKVPNMRIIDAAKRGLDAQINDNSNEFGHLNDLGRTQAMLKSALVGQAKSLNPAYANYLNTAADEYSLQSAAKLGRGIWNSPNKEETITQLSNLSAPQKQMALQGAVRSFMEQTEKSPDSANLAATKLTKPYWRDILSPLVDDPTKLDGLVGDLQTHADAFRRNATWLNQSRTALRGQFNGEAPSSIGELVAHLIGKVKNEGGVNDRVSSILFDQNPATSIPNLQKAVQLANPSTPQNFAMPTDPTGQLDYKKLLGLYYSGAGNNNQGN